MKEGYLLVATTEFIFKNVHFYCKSAVYTPQ